jgi:serine/threonine-protein kinase
MRQEGGYPYFTMSLVKGKDLKDWINSRPLVDFATLVDFLEIISKVCDALEFAHRRGVVHCDIKAQNVMVGEAGQVYLMDWGGAELRYTPEMLAGDGEPPIRDTLPRLPAEQTEGKIFGTLSYIAPERAQGERPDARSDIFSMGGLIYAFLTGKPPFEAEHAAESFELARDCRYDPIDEKVYAGIVPRGLYGIVRKAMAPNPADRYPSVAALKDDLNNILRGGGTFPAVKVKAGEVIIREGDPGDAAYIVAKGRLQVYREPGGNRVNIRVLEQGEVFGEMAILTSSPRTASVSAVTDSLLVKITEDVILGELDTMKPWMAAFVQTLAHRFLERESRDRKAQAKGDKSKKSWFTRR